MPPPPMAPPPPAQLPSYSELYTTKRSQQVSGYLRQVLSNEQLAAWNSRTGDILCAPHRMPAETSVKFKRQAGWRAWVVSVIYSIAEAYDPLRVRAYALLESSPQLDVEILWQLVVDFKLYKLVRFDRGQLLALVCGPDMPPEYPTPPADPLLWLRGDSLFICQSSKGGRSHPKDYLAD